MCENLEINSTFFGNDNANYDGNVDIVEIAAVTDSTANTAAWAAACLSIDETYSAHGI